MLFVIRVFDLSSDGINLLKIDHVTIGARQPQSQHNFTLKNTLYNLDTYILQFGQITFENWTWKLTVWQLELGGLNTLSPWTLSFSSNFATPAEFLFKQDWIIIRQSAIDFIKICTVNIFPCAMHLELTQKCWTEMNNYSIQYRSDINMQNLI